jgi:hypothetical protein
MIMTQSAVSPTPLPLGAGPGSGEEPGARAETAGAVTAIEPLSIHEVYRYFLERRAAVHADLQELRAAGQPVNVPFDAVFLCEVAGLVLDLETGFVDGLAEERVAPIPALLDRLAGQGFDVDGVVDGTAVPAQNGNGTAAGARRPFARSASDSPRPPSATQQGSHAMRKQALIYTRTGRAENAQAESDAQAATCAAYAAAHGYTFAGVFSDTGSGADTERRGLDELLAHAAAAGAPDTAVLVTDWDRLARSVSLLSGMVQRLGALGVQVICVNRSAAAGDQAGQISALRDRPARQTTASGDTTSDGTAAPA